MPSSRRLHPLSLFFDLGARARDLALPGLLVLFSAGFAGADWQVWAMFLIIPYAFISLAHFLSFRYRFDDNELVLRSGLLFRNERHIPYSRIQNLNGVQNPLHRLFKVIRVGVETGGGQKPEATLNVLPAAEFELLRRLVFSYRNAAASALPQTAAPAGEKDTLLRLAPGELLLYGLLHGRGTLVIAAAIGLLSQFGFGNRWIEVLFDPERPGGQAVSGLATSFKDHRGMTIGLALAAGIAIFILVRALGSLWGLVRFFGFTLSRQGEDLRHEFGLLTRVAGTIPLRRIQKLTLREGIWHRLLSRASVHAETAGSLTEDSHAAGRVWLAPLIHQSALPDFLRQVFPPLDLAALDWRPAHPRAFRRCLNRSLILAGMVSLGASPLAGAWALAVFAFLAILSFVAARLSIAHFRWATGGGALVLQSGSFWKQTSAAPFTKIQAVAFVETPFDRRAGMARVFVDTAGAAGTTHRLEIPYLARETAGHLSALLAREAVRTTFRW